MPENKLDQMPWYLTVLALLALGGCLVVMFAPFATAITWAVVLALATWPVYARLVRLMPRRPAWSAGIMTFALFLLFIVAVVPAVASFVDDLERVGKFAGELLKKGPSGVSRQFGNTNILGYNIGSVLSRLEMTGEELRARIAEYQTNVFKAATAAFKQLVSGIFNTIVCFFTLYFLYVDGKTAAGQALRALHRIGGTRFRVIAERMK